MHAWPCPISKRSEDPYPARSPKSQKIEKPKIGRSRFRLQESNVLQNNDDFWRLVIYPAEIRQEKPAIMAAKER